MGSIAIRVQRATVKSWVGAIWHTASDLQQMVRMSPVLAVAIPVPVYARPAQIPWFLRCSGCKSREPRCPMVNRITAYAREGRRVCSSERIVLVLSTA